MTTTSYEARAADINVFAPTAQAEGIAAGSSSTVAPTPRRMARAYEGFLGLPVPLVLMVLWLLGALMLGAVVMGIYSAEVWLSTAIAPLL